MQELVFHFGALRSNFALQGLFRDNRERLLDAFSVLYPCASSSYLPGYYSHNHLVAAWKPQPAMSATHLRQLREEVETAAPRALIISLSGIQYPNVNTLLSAMLRQLYPAARQGAVFGLRRQDRQFEEYCTGLFMRCAMDFKALADAHGTRYPLFYGPGVQRLIADFGRERLAWVLDDGTEESARTAQRQLLLQAGVPPLDADSLCADHASPASFLRQPREFLAFCQAHIALTDAAWHLKDFPWCWEALRIAAHTPWPEPFPSLLGPRRRAAMLHSYTATNAEATELLGLDRLFPDPKPEPDWEPFSGLTKENAFRVAERLEPDFASARLAEFDAVPVRYLTYEQRLCRQALHDALDPPSTAPACIKVKPPKLSVLTLTYNHTSYIAECIESVIAQQCNFPLQHIIADDGSEDGTQDIILDYAARYPHIVPVFQKTRSRGSRNNISALFGMARTEYVALCDGDDYFTDPLKLQTQMDFLDANPECGLCFHVARVIYENDTKRERLYPEVNTLPRGVRPFYYLSDLIRYNFMQTNTAMYRWRFKNGLPDWFRTDLMPGDWYWHLLHAETGKIGFIDKVMSVYRRHEKAVYYLAEIDSLKHRAKVGMKEIAFYDAVNKHFNRQFEPVLLDMVNGIFADCMLYETQNEGQEGFEPVMNRMGDAYPDFMRHFLRSLKALR